LEPQAQCWVKWEINPSPVGTTDVLTQTLSPCHTARYFSCHPERGCVRDGERVRVEGPGSLQQGDQWGKHQPRSGGMVLARRGSAGYHAKSWGAATRRHFTLFFGRSPG